MLKSKSFIIVGETHHRNGVSVKNIADKVDEAINSFLSSSNGKYVDLKIDTKVNPGVGTDIAFVTVILDELELERSEAEAPKKKNKS